MRSQNVFFVDHTFGLLRLFKRPSHRFLPFVPKFSQTIWTRRIALLVLHLPLFFSLSDRSSLQFVSANNNLVKIQHVRSTTPMIPCWHGCLTANNSRARAVGYWRKLKSHKDACGPFFSPFLLILAPKSKLITMAKTTARGKSLRFYCISLSL
jgi:hypothetical protein